MSSDPQIQPGATCEPTEEQAFEELVRQRATHEESIQELTIELSAEMVDMVEAWIAAQPDPKPTLPQAVVRLIELGTLDEAGEDDG